MQDCGCRCSSAYWHIVLTRTYCHNWHDAILLLAKWDDYANDVTSRNFLLTSVGAKISLYLTIFNTRVAVISVRRNNKIYAGSWIDFRNSFEGYSTRVCCVWNYSNGKIYCRITNHYWKLVGSWWGKVTRYAKIAAICYLRTLNTVNEPCYAHWICWHNRSYAKRSYQLHFFWNVIN